MLHDPNLLETSGELDSFFLALEDALVMNRNVFILVDTDCDGYCSAAMMYNYLKRFLEIENLEYVLNKNKRHGLNEEVVEYLKMRSSGQQGLLIIPDAGTNDVEWCKELSELYDIFIIDHHPAEKWMEVRGRKTPNPYATIINPQVCDYPNKNLCGAAVVYKVLQYLDNEYDSAASNLNIDLMGVAMVADIIDLRDPESRFLTTRGLMNVENKLLKAIIDRNSYSISNINTPNAIDIAFYVSPIINACIRTGTDEEKNNLFRAFIEDDRGQTFKYKPRKSAKNPEPVEIDEDFYTHVARISSNLKSSKQDRPCEKALEYFVHFLSMRKDTKLVVLNEEELDYELVGVLANKVANTVMKPTIILKRFEETNKGILFKGSARNFKNSYVLDFNKDLLESGLVESAKGHSNAFGVEIYGDKVNALIEWFENKYKDKDSSKTYYVDYIFNSAVPYIMAKSVYEMRALFSNFVEAPFVAVENVCLRRDEIEVLSSQNGNLRFEFVIDDVKYMKFKLPEDDELLALLDEVSGDDTIVLNMVGKPSVSFFAGKATPQFIIDDYDCIKGGI